MRMRMPGEIGDREEHGNQRHGRAEIRFPGNQRERQTGEAAGDGQVGPGRRAAVLAEELGEHQRHADLGELGRLQVDDPPSGIQRRAPICTVPKNSTYSSSASSPM